MAVIITVPPMDLCIGEATTIAITLTGATSLLTIATINTMSGDAITAEDNFRLKTTKAA